MHNTYEVISDDSTVKYFNFTLTNSTNDVYVLIDFYNKRMYPEGCRTDSTTIYPYGSYYIYGSDGTAYTTNISIYDSKQA